MTASARQASLDLRPPRPPRADGRGDPELALRLRWLLETFCRGRANARHGAVLMRALGILCQYPCRRLRSIGEAVDLLLDDVTICSTSADGYWIATTPDEVEASLHETERKAKRLLTRRRRQRTRLAELRGQVRAEVTP